MLASCDHTSLSYLPSPHADSVGYRWPEDGKRVMAALLNKPPSSSSIGAPSPSMFPAPLVLPDDDLSLDPRCPSQSLRSWLRLKERNEISSEKNVIYVAAPPDIEPNVQFMDSWTRPEDKDPLSVTTPLSVEDVVDYLAAFYHGLSVKHFPAPRLCFTSWGASTRKSSNSKPKTKPSVPKYVGLNTHSECVRIRTRLSKDRVFQAQLNLDDLLDAAISVLPEDAYALLLIVNHDLFESKDDQFVCGRAYGGSRVAVISTARYHPALDSQHNLERSHAWPASHCTSYIQSICSYNDTRPIKKIKRQHPVASEAISPLFAALSAYESVNVPSVPSNETLSNLWLGRVCRAAAHELGHCFGMEHCVYYACAMQGSSCLAEDMRQPPYLCPVDLAKILYVAKITTESHYRAMLAFCERHPNNQLFAAYAAWIRARLDHIYS